MTNRKNKEAGINPLVGCKYVNKEGGEKEKMSGKVSGIMSGKTYKVIIEIIKQNNEETIPEMATKIGVTQRSVERNIEKTELKLIFAK